MAPVGSSSENCATFLRNILDTSCDVAQTADAGGVEAQPQPDGRQGEQPREVELCRPVHRAQITGAGGPWRTRPEPKTGTIFENIF